MKVCTFFGHRDAPDSVKPAIRQTVIELIEKDGVTRFYVGNQGRFDGMVASVLKELKDRYPFDYAVVLAYFPKGEEPLLENSLFPDDLEKVPPRFAIARRNQWMVEQSDYVVCYLRKSFGGAATFAAMAKRKNKKIIQIN